MAKSNLKASREDEYATAVALAELLTSGQNDPELMKLAEELGITKKTTAQAFRLPGLEPIGPSGTSFHAPTPEERLQRAKVKLGKTRANRMLSKFKGSSESKKKDLKKTFQALVHQEHPGVKKQAGIRTNAMVKQGLPFARQISKFGGWPLMLLMGMLPMLMGEEE